LVEKMIWRPTRHRKTVNRRAFRVWFDRWEDRRWCWRETRDSPYHTGPGDITSGSREVGRLDAIRAIEAEIARRKAAAGKKAG
jgi:hypothetical protein